MNSRAVAVFASVALLATTARAANDSFHAPDSIVLKDGRKIHGLIIKNSVDSILMQEEFGERAYPKSEIVRVLDEPDTGTYFTELISKGTLPSWRVIANDLRTHDQIKSVVQIPATTVTVGNFRNVPYLSFLVNRDVELNIYGDPNHPAGVELGIYGSRKNDVKAQKILRAYFAGFLGSREEVAALYQIGLKKGKATAGSLSFEVTPPTAPDAEGAWWVSLYNLKTLDAVRLPKAKYDALTKPPSEVVDREGRIIAKGWTEKDLKETDRLKALHGEKKILLRGFYRDKNGNFQLLTAKSS
ncbi:MAG: hypothetical protein WCQ16_10475 [Verrucomicrobiae bacterium]